MNRISEVQSAAIHLKNISIGCFHAYSDNLFYLAFQAKKHISQSEMYFITRNAFW